MAREFSPRYERHRDDLVSIDVSGLGRLLGPPRAIGEELRRDAAARGVRVHIAIARTRTAAMILALARPGLTVEPDRESEALAPIPIGVLERMTQAPAAMPAGASAQRDAHARHQRAGVGPREKVRKVGDGPESAVPVFRAWGVKTLGELAALPSADLAARLGIQGLVWQAIARGEDGRPLVPDVAEEPFESTLDLEWPIEGLEPLSFVLTRLLEPIVTRLECRDRGVAVLHVELQIVRAGLGPHAEGDRSASILARRLQLPTPLRDVRTLRTLALVDLESHPPAAAVERVTVRVDPTPARIVQHALFTRAQPTPEQLSTLIARLSALMGQDRVGAPAELDSYRPGAFAMTPFATDRDDDQRSLLRVGPHPHALAKPSTASASSVDSRPRRETVGDPAPSHQPLATALRRCRQPVPARVAVAGGRPVRVTTDRHGLTGGTVLQCAGPWRTSGEWWSACGYASGRERDARRAREASASGGGAPRESEQSWAGGAGSGRDQRRPVLDTREGDGPSASGVGVPASARAMAGPPKLARSESEGGGPHASKKWHRDEWDVALSDGAVYRLFQDRDTDGWFIDAVVD